MKVFAQSCHTWISSWSKSSGPIGKVSYVKRSISMKDSRDGFLLWIIVFELYPHLTCQTASWEKWYCSYVKRSLKDKVMGPDTTLVRIPKILILEIQLVFWVILFNFHTTDSFMRQISLRPSKEKLSERFEWKLYCCSGGILRRHLRSLTQLWLDDLLYKTRSLWPTMHDCMMVWFMTCIRWTRPDTRP